MMRPLLWLRRQWLGALALSAALTATSLAATGQFAHLGALNTADRPTVIQNTGAGTALELKVAAGQIPLRVNSSVVVPKLNAALLAGKPARKYAPASGSPKYAPASGSPNYAPASGSPNYVASNAAQVLLSDTFAAVSLTGTTPLNTTVTAPGDGQITLLAAGSCFAGAEKVNLIVNLGAGAVTSGDYVASACAVAVGRTVTKGQQVSATFSWATTNVTNGQVSGYYLVAFDPASGGS